MGFHKGTIFIRISRGILLNVFMRVRESEEHGGRTDLNVRAFLTSIS